MAKRHESIAAHSTPATPPSWSGGFSGGFAGTHTVYAPRPDDPSRFTVVDTSTTGQHNHGFVATHTAGTGSLRGVISLAELLHYLEEHGTDPCCRS
jgi:hypothetical protein